MNNKIIVGLLVVALGLGLFGSFKNNEVTVVNPDNGQKYGVVSPYSPTPELNLGGLRLVGVEKALVTGTSTVCAIQSPSATSTLLSGGVKFTLASTSAVSFDITNATTRYASSTKQIGTAYTIGASAQATIVASSTDVDATFAPSQWFVAKYYDANAGATDASTGRCWAVFAVPQ